MDNQELEALRRSAAMKRSSVGESVKEMMEFIASREHDDSLLNGDHKVNNAFAKNKSNCQLL